MSILNDLKVGDKVIIHRSYENGTVAIIAKLTPTQILIESLTPGNYFRYRKSDGKAHDQFDSSRIEAWTEEQQTQIDLYKKRKILNSVSFRFDERQPGKAELINEVYAFLESKNLLPK